MINFMNGKFVICLKFGVEILIYILLMIVKSLASRLLNKQTVYQFAKSKVKDTEGVAQLRKGQISQVNSIIT